MCILSKTILTNHGMILRFDELHGKKDRQEKKAVKTGNETDWVRYKRLRHKVNNQRKPVKESFYNNLELIITVLKKKITKENFGNLSGILSNPTVHLQLSLLSLLPFLWAKHNGHSLIKQTQTT